MLHPAFTAWRTTGALAPCRILLPGAGRGGEPLSLARDGFDVTVVEPSAKAVAVQVVRLQAAGLTGAVHAADLLAWRSPGTFDAIYDEGGLSAQPPPARPSYVAKLRHCLRPGGHLFILLAQTGQPGGPPFDCPLAAVRPLFGGGWQWPDAEPVMVPHPNGRGDIPLMLRRV